MTDIQAAERRIDELVDDLIEAARAVEMHSYAPPGRGRAIEFPAAQADLQAAREAIAEYVAAALRAAEQDAARLREALDWVARPGASAEQDAGYFAGTVARYRRVARAAIDAASSEDFRRGYLAALRDAEGLLLAARTP
jgi:hypothetical protein